MTVHAKRKRSANHDKQADSKLSPATEHTPAITEIMYHFAAWIDDYVEVVSTRRKTLHLEQRAELDAQSVEFVKLLIHELNQKIDRELYTMDRKKAMETYEEWICEASIQTLWNSCLHSDTGSEYTAEQIHRARLDLVLLMNECRVPKAQDLFSQFYSWLDSASFLK